MQLIYESKNFIYDTEITSWSIKLLTITIKGVNKIQRSTSWKVKILTSTVEGVNKIQRSSSWNVKVLTITVKGVNDLTCLMTNIPKNSVLRSIEDVVHSHRQLDDTESGTQMASGVCNRKDHLCAQLIRQLIQLRQSQVRHMNRVVYSVENRGRWFFCQVLCFRSGRLNGDLVIWWIRAAGCCLSDLHMFIIRSCQKIAHERDLTPQSSDSRNYTYRHSLTDMKCHNRTRHRPQNKKTSLSDKSSGPQSLALEEEKLLWCFTVSTAAHINVRSTWKSGM